MTMAIVKYLAIIMQPSQKTDKETVISLLTLRKNLRDIWLKRETEKGESQIKKNTRQSDRINCGYSALIKGSKVKFMQKCQLAKLYFVM